MEYFRRLQRLLKMEKEEDRRSYEKLLQNLSVTERRAAGLSWYPVAIRDTETGRGDYLTVEVERTTHHDIIHQLRFGMAAALFSQHDAQNHRLEGVVSHISGNRLKISLRVDELPEWSRDGKLGIDVVFDLNSYEEMERALQLAPQKAEKKDEGDLVKILTGEKKPGFHIREINLLRGKLNQQQMAAVAKIVTANELAVVHGPPGTGKTTTLIQAIKEMHRLTAQQILVTAPSNAAVDLLSEKLTEAGMNVVRVGNPARVSEKLMMLTLDSRMSAHAGIKEIKRLKKQAAEYRDLAHKYKRQFGASEREQRKALFTEARNIAREVERLEEYIVDDVIGKAEVIAATLVGASHYTIRHLQYETVVIDEAGQSVEPACWIPILKTKKLVMAGDHCQLPPTIKSAEAAREGFSETLMEKVVALHPEAVVQLQEQYRMHEKIMGFPSLHFYEGSLRANSSVVDHLIFNGDAPLLFIDTAGCGFDEKIEGTGISNPEEAAFLLKHLSLYLSQIQESGAEPSVAVISPYKHQVEILKEAVLHNATLRDTKHLAVNTIDSFQGQERDIVYISMTRSNADNIIGFLSEVRRMNVAMTRARKKLVVVGDSATLSQFPFYASFIEYAEKNEAYKSAWEFMGD